MKNLFYLIMTSALLMVGGCVKEVADDNAQFEQDPALDIPMKTVTLDASMMSQVKSIVDDEGGFAWTLDDAIAVNVRYVDKDENPVNAFFKLAVKEISSDNDNLATFEGKIPENGEIAGVAVYPYDKGHVYSDGNLSVNFPSQVSESNHLPAMYAKVEGETLQFQHLSSMLKLTYRYVPKGTDGMILTSAAVSGLYDVNLETGALTATENVADQVKVTFDALTTMQAEKAVYVPVPAGERSIAAKLTKGEEMVKWSDISSKSARNFEVGKINLLPAVNVHFSELYILGGSKDAYDWETGEMKPMEETEDHVFTWTGRLLKGNDRNGRFRFPVETGYYPAIYKVDGNPVVKFENMGNDYDFTVDRDGYYAVTVNATDMDDIQVDIEYRYPSLFIVGRATEFGYENSDINDEQWMTMVSDGVYEWTGWLTDDIVETDKTTYGAFKFLAQKGAWYPAYNRVEGEEWKLIENPSSSSDISDIKFTIKDGDGIYKITANLNTMMVTATQIEATQDLYITGRTTAASGFSATPATDYKFTYVGNGVYTWTGTMKVDTGNGFKIIAYGNLTPCWGPVGGGTKTGSIGDGKTEWNTTDRKWDLKSSEGYSEGIYTIVLDTGDGTKGTISVTPM